jgi:VanZ family protein
MSEITTFLRRWLPAILIMGAIYVFSSIPSYEMPNFAWADTLVKKGGHMLGYGLLALAYLGGLLAERNDPKSSAVAAWLLALLYACSDEFHQIFVAGRHASLLDVGIDAIGAAIALAAWAWFRKRAFRNSGISHR